MGGFGRDFSSRPQVFLNSYATGVVTAGGSDAGGLIGSQHDLPTISKSYAVGAASASSNAGGLVGNNSASSTISEFLTQREHQAAPLTAMQRQEG